MDQKKNKTTTTKPQKALRLWARNNNQHAIEKGWLAISTKRVISFAF
jgi:hypothetical protein